MREEGSKVEIIRELCRKWPTHGNLTVAKAAYKQYPHLWSTVDAARCTVRYVRGAHGADNAKGLQDKSLVREKGHAGQPTLRLPQSVAKPWTPYEAPGSRHLILSDVHIPYHDKRAVTLALETGLKFNPDSVILNGDIADFYAVSRWQKDPKQINFGREIRRVKEFLEFVRKTFPKANLIWKLGNHEERWELFLWQKAPELIDIPEFSFASVFGLADRGITLAKDQRPIMCGKLPVMHGHEYPKGMTNPVNQARGMFLRGLECAMAGHGHRTSEHCETTMLGRLITCWSTGCLCDLTPAYARINKWSHGFALIEVGKQGEFTVSNKRIYAGRVW